MGRPKKRKVTHSKRRPMTKAEIRRRFQVANMVDAQFKEWAVTDVMSIFLATLHHLPKDPFGIGRLKRLYDKMKELDSDIAAGYGNIRQLLLRYLIAVALCAAGCALFAASAVLLAGVLL